MKYTDEQLIKRVESYAENFKGWKKGVIDIWVRSTPNVKAADLFNDKVYTFYCEEDGELPDFRMVCTGTSHTGLWALRHFKKYNHKGAAVLKSNYYVFESHKYGRHKNYNAYRQQKGFPYYRDKDMDNLAEEKGKVYNDIIFANSHRAHRKHESKRIWNWSSACMVRNKPNQFYGWLAYMNKRPLSSAILREW